MHFLCKVSSFKEFSQVSSDDRFAALVTLSGQVVSGWALVLGGCGAAPAAPGNGSHDVAGSSLVGRLSKSKNKSRVSAPSSDFESGTKPCLK